MVYKRTLKKPITITTLKQAY